MDGGGPNFKGLVLLGIVAALKAERARAEPLLNRSLRRYLDLEVDVDGWYPTEDVLDLLRVLAQVLGPQAPWQDAMKFFGAVAAQRELLGEQALVQETHRVEAAGWYRGAIQAKHDLATTVRRACALWQLYNDAGEFRISRLSERTLCLRHVDYPLVREENCHLTTGYFEEVARIAGIDARFEKASCRVRGAPVCEWRLVLGAGVDVSSLVAFDG